MSKSWADLIPNQTPCSYDKWRAAETEASKYRMLAQATEDMRIDAMRATCKFVTALGMHSGEVRVPTKGDFQALCGELGWDVPDNCKSMTTPDQSIEQEIQAKGKTAPRVTPADLQESIASEHYFTAADGVGRANNGATSCFGKNPESLSSLTFCVLVLRNGFTVTGESACASPENFDAEIGRKIARQNAESKCWPLMGYALKEKLASA